MATISNTPRPGYVWDSTDNVWYPIGVGGHGHTDYITQATAVNPTIIDAKGDIITATAADTPARLAVGANGETLVANSSTATGLSYQGNFAAGKNKIINGDFGIWQRGTSFTSSGVYTADRFLTNTDAGVTVSQQTFTPGTAPVAGYEGQYFLRWAKSAGGSYLDLAQRIEDVRTFAGQTITLSFWAKVSSGTASVEPYYVQDFGTGGSGAVAGALTAQTINTSWARYSFNLVVPSVTGKTIGTSSRLQISPLRILTSGAVTADIWGVQIEVGSVATAFQTATGTIQGELAACKRYFNRMISASGQLVPGGLYFSATNTAVIGVAFPVEMRTTPTLTATAANFSIGFGAGSVGSNGVTTFDNNTQTVTLVFTAAGTPFTVGQSGRVNANTTTSLDWSAEL